MEKKKVSKGPAKKAKKKAPLGFGSERNVLFRPDRYKYVRKVDRPPGCVFCDSEKSGVGIKSLSVYQSRWSMILLNKFPYNSGHLLVLPRHHCGDFLKLTSEEYIDLHQTVRIAFETLQEVYSPLGINLGMNHGAVAGAGIPEHLHYHIIPRWAGDLNFFPLIAQTKVVVETLEETFAKVSGYLKDNYATKS